MTNNNTIEQLVKSVNGPTRIFTIFGQTLYTKTVNPIEPIPAIQEMTGNLYKNFNDDPNRILDAILEETEEPIAISKELMNGAKNVLLDNYNSQLPPQTRYARLTHANALVFDEVGDENIFYIFNDRFR